MHRRGVGITCFIKPIISSIFDKRSLLRFYSSCFFNMPSMLNQCSRGFLIFSFVASPCTSMISSFKTHSRGLPGFLACAIKLRLFIPKFKQLPNKKKTVIFWQSDFSYFCFLSLFILCFFGAHFNHLISAESETERATWLG